MSIAPVYLELETWPRRATFQHFLDFESPFFGITTRLDVTRLKPALAAAGGGRVSLALHYAALRQVHAQPPFCWRLEGRRVRCHERIGGSTTVLRDDGSFGFAALSYDPDHARFAAHAAAALAAVRSGDPGFDPRPDDEAVIHFTTLPWLHFSSFRHARHGRRSDSVPKIAFGRIDSEGEGPAARQWLPLSIDVHHALMDGLEVGRYVQGLQALLHEPEAWLAPAGGCA